MQVQRPFREILVWKFSRFIRKREHAVAFKSMLRPCILVAGPNSDFTEVEWGAADRSALGHQRPLSSKGRRTVSKQSPNGCPGRLSPHRARNGQHST